MKFFISTILIAALSFAACLFMPWWVIAIAGFVVAFAIPQKNGLAFLSGFLALFILWAGMSIYMSNANDNLFVHKMSVLFLKKDNSTMLFILTGLIGGLVAGLGSLSGRLLKKMVVSK
jgi:cell division protein FtsX